MDENIINDNSSINNDNIINDNNSINNDNIINDNDSINDDNIINDNNSINKNSINENVINDEDYIDIDQLETLNINAEFDKKATVNNATKVNSLNKEILSYESLNKKFEKAKQSNKPIDFSNFVEDFLRADAMLKSDEKTEKDFNALKANITNPDTRTKLLDFAINLIEHDQLDKADSFLSAYYKSRSNTYNSKKAKTDLVSATELSNECARMDKCLDLLSERKKKIDNNYKKDLEKSTCDFKKELNEYTAKTAHVRENLSRYVYAFSTHNGRMLETGSDGTDNYKKMRLSLDILSNNIAINGNSVSIKNNSCIQAALTEVNEYISYAENKSFWYMLPNSTGRKRLKEAKELQTILLGMDKVYTTQYLEVNIKVNDLESLINSQQRRVSNSPTGQAHESMDKRVNKLNTYLCRIVNKLESTVQNLSENEVKTIRQLDPQKKKQIRTQYKEDMQKEQELKQKKEAEKRSTMQQVNQKNAAAKVK